MKNIPNKTVLLIAYYFPNMPEVAALRIGALAKYLSDYGWKPIVLTRSYPNLTDLPSGQIYQNEFVDWGTKIRKRLGFAEDQSVQLYMNENSSRNPSLISSLSIKAMKIAKTAFCWPDYESGWYSNTKEIVDHIFLNHRIDAVISSSLPVTTHRIASRIKNKYGTPWIADFRDLWTQNHAYPYGDLRKFIEEYYERNLMSCADAMITVSDPLKEKLQTLHRGRTPVFTVENGFSTEKMNYPIFEDTSNRFLISYTGTIYPNRQSPRLFFEAVLQAIDEGKIASSDIEICFAGQTDSWNLIKPMVDELKMTSLVTYVGVLNRDEAIRLQRQSQLLLFMMWTDNRELGIYTAKIFEYLAACRPILAVGGHKSVVSSLLEETGAGVHANDIQEIKNMLISSYNQYKNRGKVAYSGNINNVMKYTHPRMVQRFVQIMDEIIEKN